VCRLSGAAGMIGNCAIKFWLSQDVLVFDATSSLDYESERSIMSADSFFCAPYLHNVIIAHRSVRFEADKIVVPDQAGSEVGSHAELLRRGRDFIDAYTAARNR